MEMFPTNIEYLVSFSRKNIITVNPFEWIFNSVNVAGNGGTVPAFKNKF